MLRAVISVCAVAVSLAIVGIVIAVLLQSNWFSDYLQQRLGEAWKRQVSWSDGLEIDWALSPHPDRRIAHRQRRLGAPGRSGPGQLSCRANLLAEIGPGRGAGRELGAG